MLGPLLPPRPLFLYKKAPSLRDRLAPGVVDPPIQSENRLFSFLSGFYACGRCTACRHSKCNNKKNVKVFRATSTGKEYKIDQLITCTTVGVVYMLQCECGLQYIGRTSRPLHVRLGEHVNNIKKGLKTHNVSKHFKLVHGQNPRGLSFWGIERVNKHWRGGATPYVNLVAGNPIGFTRPRFSLRGGLNVDFDVNCFISSGCSSDF